METCSDLCFVGQQRADVVCALSSANACLRYLLSQLTDVIHMGNRSCVARLQNAISIAEARLPLFDCDTTLSQQFFAALVHLIKTTGNLQPFVLHGGTITHPVLQCRRYRDSLSRPNIVCKTHRSPLRIAADFNWYKCY